MRSTGMAGRSTTAVLGAVVDNLQDLVRTEVRLAATELREEALAATQPLGRIFLGVGLIFYGVGLFVVTAVVLLARVVQIWASAALIGALITAVALALLLAGLRGWKLIRLKPEKAAQSLEENITWSQTASNSLRESQQRATS